MPAKKKSFEETFWNSANKLGGFVESSVSGAAICEPRARP